MDKHFCLRRIMMSFIAVLLLLLSAPAAEASGNLNTKTATKEELYNIWRDMYYSGRIFEEEPSVVSPYAAGKLSKEYLENGLAWTNYMRRIANLPPVQLDDTYNEDAQHGAVVMAANNLMSHYPSQPTDMEDAFYERAYNATSSSNIYNCGCTDLEVVLRNSVFAFMNDEDASNHDHVGHRRWILNPRLKYIGFGLARSQFDHNYVAMKVFDKSGPDIDYDYVAWPAAGNFPNVLMTNKVPWSITLNPDRYQIPVLSQLTIVLTRKSDGMAYTFTKLTGVPGDPANAFLTVDTNGYGCARNAIIFNPGSSNIGLYDGVYTVDVSGIYTIDGSPAELHYEVDFFDVENACSFMGHEEVIDEAVAATCSTVGKTEGKHCSVCNTVLVAQTEIPKLPHTEVIDQAIAATCTTAGKTEGKHCYVCNEILIEQHEIDALGHDWDDGIITTAPTLNSNGIMTYTCSVCQTTREEIIHSETAVQRIYGKDRVKTALSVAEALKDTLGVEKFDTVIIATGVSGKFADALTGSYLANVKKAPILLYTNSGFSAQNVAFIRENLKPDGTVYILGGTGAVPAKVEETLSDYKIKRLFGNTRYETCIAILNEAGVSDADEILIATGTNFADSLSASAVGKPLLLVNGKGNSLFGGQVDFLESVGDKKITIIGGSGAVNNDIEFLIEYVTGVTPERISGDTRYNTSALIAQKYFDDPEYALITYGKNFPDGLAGGPLAYAMGAPLLLTNAGQESIANEYITAKGIGNGYVLGGSAVVSDETARKVFGLAADAVIENAYFTE